MRRKPRQPIAERAPRLTGKGVALYLRPSSSRAGQANLISRLDCGPAYTGPGRCVCGLGAVRSEGAGIEVFLYSFVTMDMTEENALSILDGAADQAAYPSGT
ncbi:hypothetical protein RGR602_CH01201 [Rhizobium gallicum bv. gallicum R602sp]|uniref:Uncharacterized protein n=1 Tax=Rhizobium gallicum bv. gallicum R602sp TaxID=1041138 RepID=A0A0B4WY49_9HYPH|nr:hypothetical protein RGR602_CH01201 [Rhizobium gallicum bv. gallicum R602sp]